MLVDARGHRWVGDLEQEGAWPRPSNSIDSRSNRHASESGPNIPGSPRRVSTSSTIAGQPGGIPLGRWGTGFEADRLATLETRMWKAYYQRQPSRLFGWLVLALRRRRPTPAGRRRCWRACS